MAIYITYLEDAKALRFSITYSELNKYSHETKDEKKLLIKNIHRRGNKFIKKLQTSNQNRSHIRVYETSDLSYLVRLHDLTSIKDIQDNILQGFTESNSRWGGGYLEYLFKDDAKEKLASYFQTRGNPRDACAGDTTFEEFYDISPYQVEEIRCQLKQFIENLAQLNTLRDALEEKAKIQPKKYAEVSKKATTLQDELFSAQENFFGFPTRDNFQQFKQKCQCAINKVENEFKKHRGFWNQIHPILKALIGVLATLTILPALAVKIWCKQGYTKTFFSQPTTNSTMVLDKFKEKMGLIQNDIENIITTPRTR